MLGSDSSNASSYSSGTVATSFNKVPIGITFYAWQDQDQTHTWENFEISYNKAAQVPTVETEKYQVVMAPLDSAGNMGFGTTPYIEEFLQWPPIGGVVSNLDETQNSGKTATWTISGVNYGNGNYVGTMTVNKNSNGPYRMFNNDTSDKLKTGPNIDHGGFSLETPEPFILDHYIIRHQDNAYTESGYTPKWWRVEVSHDGSTWVTIDTQTDQTITSNEQMDGRTYTIDPNHNTAYKHHRLYVVANNGKAELYIGEWQLFSKNNVSTFTPVSTLKTTITSTTLDATEGITLTGDVTADENNETTYYALATTKQISTNAEARTLIDTYKSNTELVITEGVGSVANIDIDGTSYPVTLDKTTDASTDKTPWILVLNYMHQGGTNPDLNVRDTTKGFPQLPADGSLDFNNVDINATVQDGSVYHPASWGHTNRFV